VKKQVKETNAIRREREKCNKQLLY